MRSRCDLPDGVLISGEPATPKKQPSRRQQGGIGVLLRRRNSAAFPRIDTGLIYRRENNVVRRAPTGTIYAASGQGWRHCSSGGWFCAANGRMPPQKHQRKG